jgi:hypothetical protein
MRSIGADNSYVFNNEYDVASDLIEPSEEDTLEYVMQHQFKLDTCGCKNYMGSHAAK